MNEVTTIFRYPRETSNSGQRRNAGKANRKLRPFSKLHLQFFLALYGIFSRIFTSLGGTSSESSGKLEPNLKTLLHEGERSRKSRQFRGVHSACSAAVIDFRSVIKPFGEAGRIELEGVPKLATNPRAVCAG